MKGRALHTLSLAVAALTLLASCSKRASGGADEQLILAAVQAKGAASADASRSDLLCELAEAHLDYMISQSGISHDNFSDRHDEVIRQGGRSTGEIVASNCGYRSAEQAARQCAEGWEKSPGHNEAMRASWDAMCYQMKLSEDGCYYCIGLFANGLGSK